jgi:hypothetical protein
MIDLRKKLKKWEDKQERKRNCGYALCKKRKEIWEKENGISFNDPIQAEKLHETYFKELLRGIAI